ncbi:helix-turn-helix domain-containing protein [Streptomyces sp. AgN23]|uniref:helix-turn-helix domain-containing protein n=1 Tax=Streptomyces sp. AgN23 TaxID=1188315 RepID=UPI001FF66310|nr:helix-turn-helix domain-containing protein [Streptomyces sp. AgN23]WTB02808.1 helix-turn-helix domain-containing protein [Streptomyces antimycoticus]WTB11312.1 helix-turn-helix domain-containing protein [Streptomyces antimycoticus]
MDEVLLTTGQAAEELGCAVTTFRRLVHAGVLPGLSRRGVRVMVPLEVVQTLRDRVAAPLEHLKAREVGVLRADVAKPVKEHDRQWLGFSASLPPEDLLKALRGWWRCDAASIAAGGVLPVTLSGYVVAVLTGLKHWEKDGRGRHGFPEAALTGYITDLARPVKELTAPKAADRELADLLLGTRLTSHAGGTIAYVTTQTPPA